LGLVEPGVLALDEPTNHLDLEAKDLLAETLARFEGTILLISHDRPWWKPLGFREFIGRL
jgi:ATPase subunit of ABC transporter with duplicated ATPase domains